MTWRDPRWEFWRIEKVNHFVLKEALATQRRVVITGGGTGGHVFPGMAVAEGLKSDEVVYLGSSRGFEKSAAEKAGISFFPIKASPMAGKGALRKLFNSLVLCAGFFQALFALARIRPNIVVGMGGYVSAPVLLAAWILRIPTLLLEQNLLPGRTTRFFSGKVSRVLVSFEESKEYLQKARVVVTGNPVRSDSGRWDKEAACSKLEISAQAPTLLFTGASQGAQSLNRVLLQALPLLAREEWQVLHLTGRLHYDAVRREASEILAKIKMAYKVFPFVDEMGLLYGACDLVVARGGATSMAEITLAGKPSILVPYPFAADNHQEINARWLEAKGGCRVLLEKDLSAETLHQMIKEIIGNAGILSGMQKKAKAASHPDALERILAVVKEVAQ